MEGAAQCERCAHAPGSCCATRSACSLWSQHVGRAESLLCHSQIPAVLHSHRPSPKFPPVTDRGSPHTTASFPVQPQTAQPSPLISRLECCSSLAAKTPACAFAPPLRRSTCWQQRPPQTCRLAGRRGWWWRRCQLAPRQRRCRRREHTRTAVPQPVWEAWREHRQAAVR